jgi:hypothetical protein
MDFLFIVELDNTPVKISEYGPYVFMGLTVAVLGGVGLYRWYAERRRKQSIERELHNTMGRQEQRRLARKALKSQQ